MNRARQLPEAAGSAGCAGRGIPRGTRNLVLGALIVLLVAVPASEASAQSGAGALERYAAGTWRSFVAMTDEQSGLPADTLRFDGTRSVQTSTTNIGAYMWSTVVAEKVGLIGRDEAVSRLDRTLHTLEGMERHEPSGQFYNWYDYRNGEKLTTWPPSGEPLTPILSSVDNGWLATGLRIAGNAFPELKSRTGALYSSMNFGFYYRPEVNRILFHYAPDTGAAPCCYDTIVSESRIASYIGIAKGELPKRHYFGAWRSFPNSCDWSWQETRPVGFQRTYYGASVFDGAYPYAGTRVTPSWGGSMFEALMPALFLPEERWAPGSWGSNHPLTVDAQRRHGLVEAAYGYWGFSPSNIPEGGYRAYGVDAVGMDPNGNPSNNDGTLVDAGFAGCPKRDPKPAPAPSAYTNGVVTPHAAFLGLRWRPAQVLEMLGRLERDFAVFDQQWGFRDSVNVDSGRVSDFYLSLDQGMIMAALGNALAGDVLRRYFVSDDGMARALRPVMGVEEFNSDPRGCTVTGTRRDDELRGTSGDDVICGLGGDDRVLASGGDDAVFGDDGDDEAEGGAGDDTLYGGPGDDELAGGDAFDVLSGGPGDDVLRGGPGDDHHEGGAGANRCPDLAGGDTANACG
ncbi:MAG TPA: glucoamylase family protein [Thermoleophilaceae bacterium]|nr:glucoamylase family protein [Thermoleophilaceae bacterium]